MQPGDERTKTLWIAIAILAAASFFGSWMFDLISVPAEYTCDLPFYRLEGDFCGQPISPLSFLRWSFSSGDASTRTVESIPMTLQEWTQSYSFIFIVFLLILPIFSSLLRAWKPAHRSLRIFHRVVLGLAVLLMVTAVILSPNFLHPALWGVWLYRIVILAAVGLEFGLIFYKPAFFHSSLV